MATTTNYGWETPDDTDLVKDGASAIRTLGSSIDTTLKAQIDAQIPDSIFDAKGDLLSATAADTPARLAVGTNGQYLKANSATSTGLEWADVSAGGMTLIQETTASALSSLSFTSIPSTYTDLVLVWQGVYHSASSTLFDIRLNNDSGSNYYYSQKFCNPGVSTFYGTTTVVGYGSGQDMALFSKDNNITSTDLHKSTQGIFIVHNYSSTTKVKYTTYNTRYWNVPNGDIFGHLQSSTIWNSTAAVTSIDIFRGTGSGTFSNATNTSIRLYGVK